MSSTRENGKVSVDVSPGRIRLDLYSFQTGFTAGMQAKVPSVISVLSSIVERAVVRNERVAASGPAKYRVFDGFEVPDMSIEQYLGRIFRYVNCSPSVLVVAYAYIDLLIQMHPHFRITCLNVHRLLITSVMVASKFVEDMNYRNSYYARVAGVVSTEEMNKLEIEFLFLMGFKFHVTANVYESYCCHLEREVALGGRFQIERSLRFFCEIDQSSAARSKYCIDHRHFLKIVYHKS